MLVTFVPESGFKGSLKMLKISKDAKVKTLFEFAPPTSMNRFIALQDEAFYLTEADFFTAPEGAFSVEKINKEAIKK